MRNYLDFVYSGIPEPSGNALNDGRKLAEDCLKNLAIDNKNNFPPKLLILLASREYLENAKQLLKGINEVFNTDETADREKVQLIGSSVAAVFFKQKIHPQGALLICLASNLIDVQIACGKNAREKPDKAVDRLLNDLGINSTDTDPNPLANKLIMTFFPGVNQNAVGDSFYPAPEIHKLLYQKVKARIMLTGGVSSANDRTRKIDGVQFFGEEVLSDSIVAASLITGVPIGVGLNDALYGTGDILSVNDVGENGRTITQFNDSGSSPQERLDDIGRGKVGKDLMLAKMTSDDERVLDLPLKINDQGWIGLLRPVERGDYFEALLPETNILKALNSGIEQSRNRVSIESPIGSLLFPCKSYLRFHEQKLLDIEAALGEIEKSGKVPCVGGFFDGEIGVDRRGRSRLTNGSVIYVTFGDEMRERTPLYKGVSALARFGPELLGGVDLNPDSINKAADSALKIVSAAGFPGAMLSLLVSNLDRKSGCDKEWIIASKAVGARFSEKVVELTKRELEGDDILAIVAKSKASKFISNSKTHPNCDKNAVRESGTISQYVIPLKRVDDSVFGTLQVDVGDLQHLSQEEFCKTEKARMLDCLAEVIGGGLSRIAGAREKEIMLDIDKALNRAMSVERFQDGIQTFIEGLKDTFGVEMGHVWLTDTDEKPENLDNQALFLKAGFGEFFKSRKEKGAELQAEEASPVFLAYREKGPHIINNLTEDPVWKNIVDDPAKQARYEKLYGIQSYAAIRFETKDKKVLGVISLGSTEPWFFLKFHQNAMEVLADRLHFLVEHLKTKIHHNFLLAVSPKLTERNLNSDTENILKDVTSIFCKALDAEFASLYLWDEDKKKYVLRAEANWVDKRWLHAASYSKDIGWIGLKREDNIPVYESDMYAYYKNQEYKYPQGRYAKYLFGKPLSENFTVEAIGLPLQIGPGKKEGNTNPEKKDKFGVMTLYRRIKKGQISGFVTKNIELLQEGAYQAAGLINAVIEERDNIWGRQEARQRHNVHQVINSIDDGKFFEGEVCRAVLDYYNASEVDLYRIDNSKKISSNEWIIGYRRNEEGEIKKTTTPFDDYSEKIKKELSTNGECAVFNRRELKEPENSNLEARKLEGIIDEAFLPLISDNEYFAALVIRWNPNPDDVFLPEVQIKEHYLKVLGRIVASSYSKHRQKKQIERGKIGIETAGVYVFQYAHRFVNALQRIYRISQKIRTANAKNNKRDEIERIEELENEASLYMGEMDWIFDLGELIQNPNREPLHLYSLVEGCWEKVKKSSSNKIVFDNLVADEIYIEADRRLIKEVFTNIMKNAQNAAVRARTGSAEQKAHRLEISAKVSPDKEKVEIIFRDNGKGMTKKQIDDATRGFVHTRRKFHKIEHKGVGVLISKYLLRVQNGSLRYESVKGKGTDAIVELPHLLNRR